MFVFLRQYFFELSYELVMVIELRGVQFGPRQSVTQLLKHGTYFSSQPVDSFQLKIIMQINVFRL